MISHGRVRHPTVEMSVSSELEDAFRVRVLAPAESCTGYLFNMKQTEVNIEVERNLVEKPRENRAPDQEKRRKPEKEVDNSGPKRVSVSHSCVVLYLTDKNGDIARAVIPVAPYMLLGFSELVSDSALEDGIKNKLPAQVPFAKSFEVVSKSDLDDLDHLSGRQRLFIKASFFNVNDLQRAKRLLGSICKENAGLGVGGSRGGNVARGPMVSAASVRVDMDMEDIGASMSMGGSGTGGSRQRGQTELGDIMNHLIDLREHDIPLVTRVAIDDGIRCGRWYKVQGYAASSRLSLSLVPKSFGSGVYPEGAAICQLEKELVTRPPLRVFAWDIETKKAPLKFPDASIDPILMISVQASDHTGFLIVNGTEVSRKLDNIEFTPKPEYQSCFEVINCADEAAMLTSFVELIRMVSPHITVSYNGDSFDFPYVEKRCAVHGIDFLSGAGLIHIGGDAGGDKAKAGKQQTVLENYYCGLWTLHLDCLEWVQRDSYLPQGSHGLKAVAKSKLKYDPVELDPEQITPLAMSDPQLLASYSVSDALATYQLFKTYILDFNFALASIIPAAGDDVLRKGSGTLCEYLLMAQAFQANVVFPNKHEEPKVAFHGGRMIETSTYEGGRVECLRTGIFRADFVEKFSMDAQAIEELMSNARSVVDFFLQAESGVKDLGDVVNYDEVVSNLTAKLQVLKQQPVLNSTPLIYHLDVGAMYPNIILTNKLQPSAVIAPEVCSSCCYNSEAVEAGCQRKLRWKWRGDLYMASTSDVKTVMRELEAPGRSYPVNRWSDEGDGRIRKSYKYRNAGSGEVPAAGGSSSRHQGSDLSSSTQGSSSLARGQMVVKRVPWTELSEREQHDVLLSHVRQLSLKMYRRVKSSVFEDREETVCQRENSFYVDTVRAFRDRRYELKDLTKKWKNKMESIEKSIKDLKSGAKTSLGQPGSMGPSQPSLDQPSVSSMEREMVQAKDMSLLYDSLQLAHKCILNSFYGYVMRKGARWYSMRMAGIVTFTGSNLIKEARRFVERVGMVLELDTDGIWCILPAEFPDKFTFHLKSGKKLQFSYPCSVLNQQVHEKYSNDQYQVQDPATGQWTRSVENSIFFEVDGPYNAMLIPASTEEDRTLKKRYAVFNMDGSVAEIKGFELKRRGELKIVQAFQEEVFPEFLKGKSRQEVYAIVGQVANRWLQVLDTKGAGLLHEDIVGLICERKSMSKAVDDCGALKSAAITTARRIASFLDPSVLHEKGLQCHMVIANRPASSPPTERAIPVAIFHAEESVKRSYLRRWLNDPFETEFSLQSVVDWGYYRERLEKAIHKLIIVPAVNQLIDNPCPTVQLLDWMKRRVVERNDPLKQTSIKSFMPQTTRAQNTDGETLPAAKSGGFAMLEEARREDEARSVAYGASSRGLGSSTRANSSMFVDEEVLDPVELNRDCSNTSEWIRYSKQVWSRIVDEAQSKKPIASASASRESERKPSVFSWLAQRGSRADTRRTGQSEGAASSRGGLARRLRGQRIFSNAVHVLSVTPLETENSVRLVSMSRDHRTGANLVLADEILLPKYARLVVLFPNTETIDLLRKLVTESLGHGLGSSSHAHGMSTHVLFTEAPSSVRSADLSLRVSQDLSHSPIALLGGSSATTTAAGSSGLRLVEILVAENKYRLESAASYFEVLQAVLRTVPCLVLSESESDFEWSLAHNNVVQARNYKLLPSSLVSKFFVDHTNFAIHGRFDQTLFRDAHLRYLGIDGPSALMPKFAFSTDYGSVPISPVYIHVFVGKSRRTRKQRSQGIDGGDSASEAVGGHRGFAAVYRRDPFDSSILEVEFFFLGVPQGQRVGSDVALTSIFREKLDQSWTNGGAGDYSGPPSEVRARSSFTDSKTVFFNLVGKAAAVRILSTGGKSGTATGTATGGRDIGISVESQIDSVSLALVTSNLENDSELVARIPVLRLKPWGRAPVSPMDSKFPPIDFVRWAVSRYATRLPVLVTQWWSDLVAMSRIGGVPVLSLPPGRDAYTYVLDCLYMRMLKQGQPLVSACAFSSSGLVGVDDPESAALAFLDPSRSTVVSEPNASVPGIYRSVCLTLSLKSSLCPAALLGSLHELHSEALQGKSQGRAGAAVSGSMSSNSSSSKPGGNRSKSHAVPSSSLAMDKKLLTLCRLVDFLMTKCRSEQERLAKLTAGASNQAAQNQGSNPAAQNQGSNGSSDSDSSLISVLKGELRVITELISRLYGWITDKTSSRCHEWTTASGVVRLMTNTLDVLLGEFVKAGCKVVAANFQRVVIVTGKHSVEEVSTQWKLIREGFARNPLLRFLGLDHTSVSQVSYGLLWLDSTNFASIPVNASGEVDFRVDAHWQLSECLPPAMRAGFLTYSSELLLLPMKALQKMVGGLAGPEFVGPVATSRRTAEVAQYIVNHTLPQLRKKLCNFVLDANERHDADILLMQTAASEADLASQEQDIDTQMTDTVDLDEHGELQDDEFDDETDGEELGSSGKGKKSSTNRLSRSLVKSHEAELLREKWEFPRIPGTSAAAKKYRLQHHTGPTLEFVKSLMKVFELEAGDILVGPQITSLKADLLRLLKVDQFSQEAKFVSPMSRVSSSLCRAENVVCRRCAACTTIDTTVDPYSAPGQFKCSSCESALPKELIEAELVSNVLALVAGWHAQTVTCAKCKKIQLNECSRLCDCSGGFTGKLNTEDVTEAFQCLQSVAIPHGLNWVRETVEFYM